MSYMILSRMTLSTKLLENKNFNHCSYFPVNSTFSGVVFCFGNLV